MRCLRSGAQLADFEAQPLRGRPRCERTDRPEAALRRGENVRSSAICCCGDPASLRRMRICPTCGVELISISSISSSMIARPRPRNSESSPSRQAPVSRTIRSIAPSLRRASTSKRRRCGSTGCSTALAQASEQARVSSNTSAGSSRACSSQRRSCSRASCRDAVGGRQTKEEPLAVARRPGRA